jgi:hypothetical protein
VHLSEPDAERARPDIGGLDTEPRELLGPCVRLLRSCGRLGGPAGDRDEPNGRIDSGSDQAGASLPADACGDCRAAIRLELRCSTVSRDALHVLAAVTRGEEHHFDPYPQRVVTRHAVAQVEDPGI